MGNMALDLYEHNANAYMAAYEMMDKYGKAAIVHPTGTGKSYIAFKLIEAHPNEMIIWLSPSEYIFKTQRESLLRQDQDFPLQNVRFYTYAKLMCSTPEQLDQIAEQNPTYIILDEFHRIGAEFWSESTQKLLALCPHAKLLGLTATNVRYLDNNRDMAEELFNGHVASEMTLGEAIVRGILSAPKYVTTVFKYQQDLARYQSRVDNLRSPGIQDVNQKYLDALKRALEQADGLDKVFARHITNKNGKYIVFCSGKEHMDEMIAHVPEWFAAIDTKPTVYKALSDDPATDKAFAAFKADTSNHLKLLFCIDMLNEGVHVEGISGVILFRPTISPIIYKQQIGRALTAGDTVGAADLPAVVVGNVRVLGHRQQDALHAQPGVDLTLHIGNGGRQLRHAHNGEWLRLHRDNNFIGGGQRIGQQQANRGGTVNQTVVVLIVVLLQAGFQKYLAAHHRAHGQFKARQPQIGRDKIHPCGSLLASGLVDTLPISYRLFAGGLHQQLRNGLVKVLFRWDTAVAGKIALRVKVHHQDAVALLGQGNAEVIRCGRFPRAALLVCDCDCFHLVSSKISSMLMQCSRYSCMYCTSVSL